MAQPSPESRGPGTSPARGGGAGARRVLWFEAPGCVHCAVMRPRVEAVARRHPGTIVERIDASSDTRLAHRFDVRGTPTLVVVEDDAEVDRMVGSHGEAAVERLFVGDGTSSPETALWTATGAILAVLGLLTGPAWALVGIGAFVAGYGVFRRNR